MTPSVTTLAGLTASGVPWAACLIINYECFRQTRTLFFLEAFKARLFCFVSLV